MKQLSVLALLLAAACGDNTTPRPEEIPAPAADEHARAVVVSGTFTPGEPGVLSVLDVETLEVSERVAVANAVAEDPIVRRAGDELFVVNRNSGNNVTVLDAETFAVEEQLATGAGSNPNDVAVHGSKLYVAAANAPGLLVLERGSSEIRTIDLSALDPDGVPECVTAFRVGDEIYVACELLDNFIPRGPGVIAVVDALTDTVKTTFPLAHANPFGTLEPLPDGDLAIPTVPDFGDTTKGCVERVVTGAGAHAGGCVVEHAALGGYAARLDARDDTLYLVASFFDADGPHGALYTYDLASETLADAPLSGAGQVLIDVAACPDGSLVASDAATAANGLRVYGPDGGELTTAPLAIGLKPGSARGLVCY